MNTSLTLTLQLLNSHISSRFYYVASYSPHLPKQGLRSSKMPASRRKQIMTPRKKAANKATPSSAPKRPRKAATPTSKSPAQPSRRSTRLSTPAASSKTSQQIPVDCRATNCQAETVHQHPPALQLYNPRPEFAKDHPGYASRDDKGIKSEEVDDERQQTSAVHEGAVDKSRGAPQNDGEKVPTKSAESLDQNNKQHDNNNETPATARAPSVISEHQSPHTSVAQIDSGTPPMPLAPRRRPHWSDRIGSPDTPIAQIRRGESAESALDEIIQNATTTAVPSTPPSHVITSPPAAPHTSSAPPNLPARLGSPFEPAPRPTQVQQATSDPPQQNPRSPTPASPPRFLKHLERHLSVLDKAAEEEWEDFVKSANLWDEDQRDFFEQGYGSHLLTDF